jgi:hypothetical protein
MSDLRPREACALDRGPLAGAALADAGLAAAVGVRVAAVDAGRRQRHPGLSGAVDADHDDRVDAIRHYRSCRTRGCDA